MFRWTDFLTLAEQLVQQPEGDGLTDARLRSAISRAYYAALLTARNWIRDYERKDPPEDHTIHSFVPAYLTEAGDEEAARVAPTLRRLKGRRSDADYRDRISNVRNLARLSLMEAREVVSTIEGLMHR